MRRSWGVLRFADGLKRGFQGHRLVKPGTAFFSRTWFRCGTKSELWESDLELVMSWETELQQAVKNSFYVGSDEQHACSSDSGSL